MSLSRVLLIFTFCLLVPLTAFAKPWTVYTVLGSRLEKPAAKTDWAVYATVSTQGNRTSARYGLTIE